MKLTEDPLLQKQAKQLIVLKTVIQTAEVTSRPVPLLRHGSTTTNQIHTVQHLQARVMGRMAEQVVLSRQNQTRMVEARMAQLERPRVDNIPNSLLVVMVALLVQDFNTPSSLVSDLDYGLYLLSACLL